MSDNYRNDIMAQLREAYGKLTYTYTAHNKMANRMENTAKEVAFTKILLSSLSTGGLLGILLSDKYWLKVVTALISTILLATNLYFKDSQVTREISEHRKASDSLWVLREQYLSLMTDFNKLSIDRIVLHRDRLMKDVSHVYATTPRTDSKSYAETQRALKNEEEQFFTDEELDRMLPKHLRKSTPLKPKLSDHIQTSKSED